MKLRALVLFILPLLVPVPGMAGAEPQMLATIEVGVLANGAKFIGDKTGGAQVAIVDDETGEVLASGVTRGGTGSTARIMGAEGGRYKSIVSEGDALFTAELRLDAPRRVTVTATGPLDHPQSRSTASTTLWLAPGWNFTGDSRVILTLDGYLVIPVETAVNAMGTGRVKVSLQMLCGCPVTPGGTWDADRMIKRAVLVGPTGIEQAADLEYTGEGTVFEAGFGGKVKHPRHVRVEIKSMDDANSGVIMLPVTG